MALQLHKTISSFRFRSSSRQLFIWSSCGDQSTTLSSSTGQQQRAYLVFWSTPTRFLVVKIISITCLTEQKKVTRPMVRKYHLPNVVHLSLDRPFTSPAQCSQICTDPPEGVCNDPFHRRPFTQTLLEDFHPWQELQPHHEYDHLAGRIICEIKGQY
jgi:hypothetical protein